MQGETHSRLGVSGSKFSNSRAEPTSPASSPVLSSEPIDTGSQQIPLGQPQLNLGSSCKQAAVQDLWSWHPS